jgi:2,3-bisphosphoglycerate-dependent phosphoglycerate mutase
MFDLVLLRHGESEWNRQNLFTGWYDCDLTDTGREEALAAGQVLADAGVSPAVVHTSVQVRAIRTAELALETLGRKWLPVRRSWRLNERHYGDLTGRNKAETAERYGEEQVKIWRRSYDVPPPPIAADNPHNPNDDPRYADLPEEVLPTTECLKDVVARVVPYWYDAIWADLRTTGSVLVVAHGNSLRALVKHLDAIDDAAIIELNIPTGVPLRYTIGGNGRPVEVRPVAERYLGDPAAIASKAAAVAAQATALRDG